MHNSFASLVRESQLKSSANFKLPTFLSIADFKKTHSSLSLEPAPRPCALRVSMAQRGKPKEPPAEHYVH